MPGQDQKTVVTNRPPVLKKPTGQTLLELVREVFVGKYDVVKEVDEFEKRLKAGQAKVLTPEESRKCVADVLKRLDAQEKLFGKIAPK